MIKTMYLNSQLVSNFHNFANLYENITYPCDLESLDFIPSRGSISKRQNPDEAGARDRCALEAAHHQ
jgi:hypothetical protein